MALSIKLIFVALGTMGMASMWEAVFADMGVSLAAVVNSTRALRGKWLS
jgi:Cd2+/Zn2+-exporting ATPase